MPLGCEPLSCMTAPEDSAPCDVSGTPDVRLADLLLEMSDLDQLAAGNAWPFSSHMASSYDRTSTSPTQPGWFANNDRGQYIRRDGDEYVLMETDGPGVITRIWSANPSGTIRIYLDDAAQPAIEAPMDRLLAGRIDPFREPFVFIAARGHNFYFPVGFQKRARVTATANDLYYHVNYRRYGEAVIVQTYADGAVSSAACEYAQAAERLRMPEVAPILTQGFTADTASSDWIMLDATAGGAALTWLSLEPERLDDASLRATSLAIRFDGLQTVEVPLGDFFGSGPGLAPSENLALTMREDGNLISRFVMPFAQSVEIRLRAAGGDGGKVHGRYRIEPRVMREPLSYFHAGWTGPRRVDVFEPVDMALIRISGRGQFVGLTLNVADPDPAWWGEGDEKIYVDDESFPSNFGTGTEDYLGYAWCSTARFSTAFIGQTRTNPSNNAGYISGYRLHMLDRIPFEHSFRFDLEVLHWATSQRSVQVVFDAIYYWYGEEDASDDLAAERVEDWRIPALPTGVVQRIGPGMASCG